MKDYWNEYKTKSKNKNTANIYSYFLESNFVGLNRLLVLIYSNRDDNDPKAIQQTKVVGQLKLNADNDDNESMFVSTILEKIKETRSNFFEGSVTVL